MIRQRCSHCDRWVEVSAPGYYTCSRAKGGCGKVFLAEGLPLGNVCPFELFPTNQLTAPSSRKSDQLASLYLATYLKFVAGTSSSASCSPV